jgi:hypothetical protein
MRDMRQSEKYFNVAKLRERRLMRCNEETLYNSK